MKSFLIILICSISLSGFSQYSTSWWFETGAITDFNTIGYSAGINMGLDDKFFSLNYYYQILPEDDYDMSGDWEVNHISLTAHREWRLYYGLGVNVGGGFGVGLYSRRPGTPSPNYYSGNNYPILSMPITVGISYKLHKNIGIYSRFRLLGQNFAYDNFTPQLNLGLRLGVLSEYGKD